MPALLLLQTLFQVLEELVPAHRLDLAFLLLGEIALGELAQPLLRDLGRLDRFGQALQALEDMAEDPVELVEVALVLHQAGAREVVEILDALLGEIPVERLHQRQVFPQGDRDLGGAQLGEEGEEHQGASPLPLPYGPPGAELALLRGLVLLLQHGAELVAALVDRGDDEAHGDADVRPGPLR